MISRSCHAHPSLFTRSHSACISLNPSQPSPLLSILFILPCVHPAWPKRGHRRDFLLGSVYPYRCVHRSFFARSSFGCLFVSLSGCLCARCKGCDASRVGAWMRASVLEAGVVGSWFTGTNHATALARQRSIATVAYGRRFREQRKPAATRGKLLDLKSG